MSKVLIAGGGVGGLALAQGLIRAGFDVTIFEQDERSAVGRKGYRLSLTPDGLGALKALLPPAPWEKIVAACAAPRPGIAFLSQRLEMRFYSETPAPKGDAERYTSIARDDLRSILLQGLDAHIRFGRRSTGFRLLADDRVACLFEDGDAVEGDVLIGADGTRSAIREQLMAASNRYETGIAAISGTVPKSVADAAGMIAPPIGRFAVVMGDAPQGLFIADHELTAAQNGSNYVFWSFLTLRERLPADVAAAPPERLVAIVDEMTEGWHPRLRQLVDAVVPQSVILLHYASSRRPDPWSSHQVTLIGDAVHNMPPTGGEGANMALKDAATLCALLIDPEGNAIPDALATYQNAMRSYAFDAVDRSMVNLDRMVKRDPSKAWGGPPTTSQ